MDISEYMKSADNNYHKQKKILTVKYNFLLQFISFPVRMTAFMLLPLLYFLFMSIFIGDGYNIGVTIIVVTFSFVASCLASLLCARKIGEVNKKNIFLNKLTVFLSLAVNIAVIGITFLIGGVNAASYAALIINPFYIIFSGALAAINFPALCGSILINQLTYSVLFLILTKKKFKAAQDIVQNLDSNLTKSKENKKLTPKNSKLIIYCAASVITALSLGLTAATQYAEVEYAVLKQRYNQINFSDWEHPDSQYYSDYEFSQKIPFCDNNLAVPDTESTLKFDDLDKTPKLDGATAFFPMYAAFAENTFSAFEKHFKRIAMTNDLYEHHKTEYLTMPYNENYYYFSDKYADIFNCTKTGEAYKRLAEEKCDMIFAFEPSPEQAAYAQSLGVEFELTKIGYDAFCFFVNPQNPVKDITLDEARDIYSGKISNWKKLGGNNARIFAFTRPAGSGSQTIMESAVMQGNKIDVKHQATMAKSMGIILRVVDSYLNTPNAIGYTFMYYSSQMVTEFNIKYLSINGVEPSEQNVRSGAYILSVPFYAITIKNKQSAETLALLDWIKGEQGQQIIQKTGYVTI